MSNPRFSMLNICSSLVLSFLCCFLWDSAKGGQVGLRENMLFSHTKNNHHNLITAFRNTSVSCFRVGICYCHRCAFCCSHSTKTHTKFHQFCQTGILWKVLLPICALKGCQSFVVKYSECPVALSTLQLNLARAHLTALPVPCCGLSTIPSMQGIPDSVEERSPLQCALLELCALSGRTEHLQLSSVGLHWDPVPCFRMGPQRWSFLQQGEPQNIHTNETCVFSYLLCYWSRKSLAGCDWWYCAA